jgi:hypothetical protein
MAVENKGATMRKRKQIEMVVSLLREFARRTVQDHRTHIQTAHPQLRTINSLARDILAASRTRKIGLHS